MENLYTAYAPGNDITFIMLDVFDERDIKSTEVVGWYFGEPDEETTKLYTGKLKAEY